MLSILVGGGCAHHTQAESSADGARTPSIRSAALFESPDVAPLSDGNFESSRRDAALAVYSPQGKLAGDDWPEPGRTTLDNPRYVYYSSNADFQRLVYFGPQRHGGGDRWYGR